MMDIEKAMVALREWWSQLDQSTSLVLAGVAAIAGVLIVVFAVVASRSARQNRAAITRARVAAGSPSPPAYKPSAEMLSERHVADIVQTDKLSDFGGFCIAMMVCAWVVSIVTFIAATTVYGQIIALLIWVGGNTMFGMLAAITRTRTMRIYRPQ